MNKSTLIQQVANRMSVSKSDSLRFINTLEEILVCELRQNKGITLQGFGSFIPWEQTERQGRNPRTGCPYLIRPRTSVKFKPAKRFLESLNPEVSVR